MKDGNKQARAELGIAQSPWCSFSVYSWLIKNCMAFYPTCTVWETPKQFLNATPAPKIAH